MCQQPLLIVLTGPTAIGKTALSIDLAKALHTEIISADSRQFYREMAIGTAKPTEEETADIPHHFINNLSIHDKYNVSMYENEVLEFLKVKFQQYQTLILTGGSGLYIDAVCKGIDTLPDPDIELRKELQEIFDNQGIEILQQRLQRLDPIYYDEVDKQNHKRLMRAIEVCETSGKPYSSLRTATKKERPFRIIKIALNMDRPLLFERINLRVDMMMEQGLLEEVKRLVPYKNINALNTVGYKELFRYFDHEITLEQAITDIKTNTRRYAKRQLTWLKKDEEYVWFHPKDFTAILEYIQR